MALLTYRLSQLHSGLLRRLAQPSERGANMVEYALLIALIVVVCLSAVSTFGETVPAESFGEVSSEIGG